LPVGGLVSEGRSDQPCVSVTYDDPLGSNTWRILEAFADFGMTTTFFVVGKEAEQHPELARAILACGHEIGNHSFSHVPLTKVPDHGLRQYARAQRVIERVTGLRTGVARPPSGKTDNDVIAAAASLSMTTVKWGPSPYWWDPYPRHVAQVCLDEIRPGRIVLLHQNDAGAGALPYVLAGLAERGLRSVSVTELLGGRFLY
jgi:peptidoglycan/xylan/chitin deacetylase (PgdA/CDA1 family)